jgi:hypothetical protein
MSTYPTSSRRAARPWLALGLVGLLALTGCSDDDSDSTTTTSAAPSTQDATTESVDVGPRVQRPTPATTRPSEAYCALARELNEQDGFPTTEQLDEYQALAPGAVAEQVEVIVAAFATAAGDPAKIFGDPETAAAIEELTAFEAEACGLEPPQDPGVTEIDPAATRIDVTASDYAFAVDLPTTAGRYSLVMANDGAEPHLMVLAQLEPGVTLEEAMASQGQEGVAASFESDVAPPGAEAVVTADLTAGDWILICPIPDAAGTTHVEHGMIHEFTLT